jgi:predicted Zn-dependent protease
LTVAGILTRDEAKALCERILSRSSTDGAQVVVRSLMDGNTRYAVNQITTSGEAADVEITVTARVGKRSASVGFNTLDDDQVTETVAQAGRLASLSREDPEQMPLLEAQEYGESGGFFDATGDLTAARRADAVSDVVQRSEAAGLVATGLVQGRASAVAVANSRGLFAYHRATLASHTVTIRTEDGEGSGWAGTTHNDWLRTTPPGDLAERALEKAKRSVGRKPLDPGAYTVLLEPTAVGNLVQLLRFALSARAADEGRSFFSKPGGGNRIGERVVSDAVTLVSDPADEDVLAQPFTDEGLRVGRTVWIENGELKNLEYSRYWAQRSERAPVPLAGGFKLLGGEGSVSDLVQTISRGVLVTRFWYIRSLDPRSLRFTGLTRDGTFLIEDGRIAGPVANMRFNESLIAVLTNVETMGSAERVVASESGGLGTAVVVPPLVVRDFHFTSVSDAV